jgi:hypothetical protein
MDLIKIILTPHNWWSFKGLIAGWVAVLMLALAVHQLFPAHTKLLLFIVVIIWTILWLYNNKIPRFEKGKIGILVCIHSLDPELDKTVREDFINSLRESLMRHDQERYFDIRVVPYHVASRYETYKDVIPLLKRVKGRFLLFGTVKKRGKRHILDLVAHVRHTPLTDDSSKKFKDDISSAWISKYKLENADEVYELHEITSELVSLSSRYIIALAAFASQLFSLSEILFSNVRKDLISVSYPNHASIKTIKVGTTEKLNIIVAIQSNTHYKLWKETKDAQHISILDQVLNKSIGVYKRNGEYLTYKAIVEVVLNSDYTSAKKYLMKIKLKYRDVAWHINLGFLDACLVNEVGSINHYSSAVKINNKLDKEINLEKIAEFEDFLYWYTQQSVKHEFLYYLLGVLNEDFKGDIIRAKEDYDTYLKSDSVSTYPAFEKDAKIRISKI